MNLKLLCENKWNIFENNVIILFSFGNIISKPIGRGKISTTAMGRLFENKIDSEAIACTDSCRSFKKFARESNLKLVQLPKGKKKECIYHLQHVNSFHSRLKNLMTRFNGVSTKYLSDYLAWFRWLEYFKTDKDIIKVRNILIHSHTTSKTNEFVLRTIEF